MKIIVLSALAALLALPAHAQSDQMPQSHQMQGDGTPAQHGHMHQPMPMQQGGMCGGPEASGPSCGMGGQGAHAMGCPMMKQMAALQERIEKLERAAESAPR